ncbi:PilZ domain-containing protein [Thiomicrorhabdus sediminis]|uniref:PilZ domain-containing protein n=1 Tax=Thiomicrorhabdus sediminis TaxID=2580412 RepID=A0A4P9K682_9GAMM|nr:PilZ domain-containing protein [Thiomicrorhabdus sediminis]QCU90542.1 PilZ domain-containing protein [Thiomicrorhabdus sediminis]
MTDREEHRQIDQALRCLNQKIKLLETAMTQVSKGLSPYNDDEFLVLYDELIQPIRLAVIAGNERTSSIIRNFDEKVLHFFAVVDRVVQNSGYDEIYSEEFVRDFDIDDDMISLRRIYGSNHSKLARLFISLYEYLDEIIRVFNDVINGRTIIEQPDVWAMRDVNISAGGIGFTTPYKLHEGMILDLFFKLDNALDYKNQVKQMHIKAKVMRMQATPKHFYVGTMFLGVKSKEIDLLNAYVFHQEVSQAQDFIQNLSSPTPSKK